MIPVYEGYSLAHSCERIDFGGRDVTQHLRNLLRKSGVNMDTSAEFELVKNMKEKFCAISSTPPEKAREKREKYTLPDGQVVELCNNEKEAGEILFAPDKIGLEYPCNCIFIQLWFSSSTTVSPKLTLICEWHSITKSCFREAIQWLKDSPNASLKKWRESSPTKWNLDVWRQGRGTPCVGKGVVF